MQYIDRYALYVQRHAIICKHSCALRPHERNSATTMATAKAAGEPCLNMTERAADVDVDLGEEAEELEAAPEAAGGMVATAVEVGDRVDATVPPVFVAEAADDDESAAELSLSVLELLHLPLSVVNSVVLAIADGVEPQLTYCCRWTALVSRSMTAVDAGQQRHTTLMSGSHLGSSGLTVG